MALKALGKVVVTTSGTPVPATKNQSVPGTRLAAHSFLIEQLAANTGKIYLGSSAMVISTLVGVYAVLPAPGTGSLPNFTATISYAPGGFNMAELYLDADNSGEGALITVLQA